MKVQNLLVLNNMKVNVHYLNLLIMTLVISGLVSTASAAQVGVDLGTAGNFAILAKSGI